MGLCSGRCFSKESLNFTSISDGQDSSFIDCDTEAENQAPESLFGILKYKTRYHSKFLNRFWARHRRQQQQSCASQGTSYARLNSSSHRTNVATNENQNYEKLALPKDAIQMQCLDVGSLLKMNERRDYKRLQCDSLTEGTLSFAGSSLDLEWEHEYDAVEGEESREEPKNLWFQSEEESSSTSSEENGRSIELSQFSSPTHRMNRQNNNYQPANSTRWHSRQRRPSRPTSRNESIRSNPTSKIDGNNKTKKNWSHTSTPDSLEWDTQDDEQKFKSEDDSLDQETVDLLNEIEWLKNRALIETGDAQWNAANRDAS